MTIFCQFEIESALSEREFLRWRRDDMDEVWKWLTPIRLRFHGIASCDMIVFIKSTPIQDTET